MKSYNSCKRKRIKYTKDRLHNENHLRLQEKEITRMEKITKGRNAYIIEQHQI